MTDISPDASGDFFETANEVAAESERLETQYASLSEADWKSDSVGRLRKRVPRDQVEIFLRKACRSGVVLLDPQDRLLVQSLVNHWIRHIGPEKKDTPEYILAQGQVGDPRTGDAIKKQRAEIGKRDLIVRWKRWDNLQRWLQSTGGPVDIFDRMLGASAISDAYLLRVGELKQAESLQVSEEYLHASRRKITREVAGWAGALLAVAVLGVFLWSAQADVVRVGNSLNTQDEQDRDNLQRVIDAADLCGNYTNDDEYNACLVGVGMAAPAQSDDGQDIFARLGLPEVDVPAFAIAPIPASQTVPSSCTGWVWLGRTASEFRNIDNPPAETPESERWRRAILTANRALMIREAQPTSARYEGESIGQVPVGGSVTALGLPVAVLRGRERQYWVQVEAPERNCVTVFIQYTAPAAASAAGDALATDLRDELRAQGYIVPGLERTASARFMREVRYILPPQATMAETLAEDVVASIQGSEPTVTPISADNVRTSRPALEIWIDFGGDVVRR